MLSIRPTAREKGLQISVAQDRPANCLEYACLWPPGLLPRTLNTPKSDLPSTVCTAWLWWQVTATWCVRGLVLFESPTTVPRLSAGTVDAIK